MNTPPECAYYTSKFYLTNYTKTQVHSTYRHSESTQLQVVKWIYWIHRNERSGQNRSNSNTLKRMYTLYIENAIVLYSKYPTDLCSNHRNVRTRRTHSIQTQIHTTYCHSKSSQRQVLNRMHSNIQNKRSDQNHLIQTYMCVFKYRKERSGRNRNYLYYSSIRNEWTHQHHRNVRTRRNSTTQMY